MVELYEFITLRYLPCLKPVSHRTHGLYGLPSVNYANEPTVAITELHSGHSSVSVKAVYDF